VDKTLVRRLGDAAVVFDCRTWQTHVLPPATLAVVELIAELEADGPLPPARLQAALHEELGLDSDTPQMQELLRMLGEIGMLGR
jgi:PqqD family protein of HPr-rel-A system